MHAGQKITLRASALMKDVLKDTKAHYVRPAISETVYGQAVVLDTPTLGAANPMSVHRAAH